MGSSYPQRVCHEFCVRRLPSEKWDAVVGVDLVDWIAESRPILDGLQYVVFWYKNVYINHNMHPHEKNGNGSSMLKYTSNLPKLIQLYTGILAGQSNPRKWHLQVVCRSAMFITPLLTERPSIR